jgi:predicted GNAT family acetyltransferase
MEEIKENSARFFIEEIEQCVAELICKLPDKITLLITHTEVNDTPGGHGIGK